MQYIYLSLLLLTQVNLNLNASQASDLSSRHQELISLVTTQRPALKLKDVVKKQVQEIGRLEKEFLVTRGKLDRLQRQMKKLEDAVAKEREEQKKQLADAKNETKATRAKMRHEFLAERWMKLAYKSKMHKYQMDVFCKQISIDAAQKVVNDQSSQLRILEQKAAKQKEDHEKSLNAFEAERAIYKKWYDEEFYEKIEYRANLKERDEQFKTLKKALEDQVKSGSFRVGPSVCSQARSAYCKELYAFVQKLSQEIEVA